MSRYLAHFLHEGGQAEAATGTGAAHNASIHVQPRAEVATGVGAALDATVSTALNTQAPAEVAEGTGAAYGLIPSVAVHAGFAAGTGQANDAVGRPHVSAQAEVATGTGSASAPAPLVGAGAVVSTGAGTAREAHSYAGDPCNAFQNNAFQSDAFQLCQTEAGLAAGLGEALGAAVSVVANAELTSGSGAAHDASVATVSVTANAEVATGTGAAYDAGTGRSADLTTGAGSAYGASGLVAPTPQSASGTGIAHDATASTFYVPPVQHFVLSAWIEDNPAFTGSFGIDSVLIGGLGQHSRVLAHFESQPASVITYGEETLDVVLNRLFGKAAALQPGADVFRIYAYIALYVRIQAVIQKTMPASCSLDAWIAGGGSFGMNAIVEVVMPSAFGMDAVIV